MAPLQPEDPPAVGPYRLLGRLGAGGQGVVYLGEAPDGRRVAVKVLRDGLAGDGRFAKEIDAARRVEPFCIAQLLDASLGGMPYIVTEYVEGPSLQEAGRHGGADLQRLAVATATALAAIHRAGVVHRDFKPGNVLLGRDGPRVIDFGIARAADASLTVTSSIVGTPAYMAPEQLAGTVLGPEVDVFAWASVMVFAATGTPPFGNDTLPAVIRRILHDEPQLGDLPQPLRAIVLACLAKDPAARPAIQDVLFQLIGAQPPPRGTASSSRARRRGRAALVSVGAVGLSAALVAGAVAWGASPSGDGHQATGQFSASPASATPATGQPARSPGSKPHSSPGSKPHGSPAGKPSATAGGRPRSTPTSHGATAKPTPTQATTKPTTSKPTASPTRATGTFRVVSLSLDGAQGTGKSCWTSSVYPVAVITGPSGRQVEYSYRWIIDGEDSGRNPGWLSGGRGKVEHGVGSSFEEGRHTVVFRLVSPSASSARVSFTVCPPYTH
ncbi:protein kinase [Nonomuraea sp. NPDC050536]|uniref:serine/threonine-protein kinase n=1 Tax=Nonomuraea sp. NPDC050536 TaxID=3364366 RepID=UPI0037C5ACD9